MVLQTKQKNIIAFLIPALLLSTLFLTAKFVTIPNHQNTFYNTIVLDFVLTIPIIYFLFIRKLNIPKTTIVPIFIIGVIIASYVIPKDYQALLNAIKTWIIPIVEISVLIFVIINIRKAVKAYKKNKVNSFDFFTTLKSSVLEIMPKRIAHFFVTEIATFYYGFYFWRKLSLKPNEFSYHKNTGTVTLLIALIFVIAIETLVLHTLLAKWSEIAAWILTILSIYSGIQIFGFAKSLMKRPYAIENNLVYLRYGIISEAIIDITNIKNIELSSKEMEFKGNVRKLSPLTEIEDHNIIITLKTPQYLTGFYGIKKKFTTLAFYVDHRNEFKNAIQNQLDETL
ncbi:hypothetical protein D7030_09400 [Flavobacteriaceae bacterium AU392]|nr:hypothetical protein D1817_07415 [Flavobacteriaceae bacterium]RKM83502.1 hypothetical protein D7030_09400 [Flavobacteriaceae bacterium AU392]